MTIIHTTTLALKAQIDEAVESLRIENVIHGPALFTEAWPKLQAALAVEDYAEIEKHEVTVNRWARGILLDRALASYADGDYQLAYEFLTSTQEERTLRLVRHPMVKAAVTLL